MEFVKAPCQLFLKNPKKEAAKRSSGINRNGQLSQEPSKKQQDMVVHNAIVLAAVPASIATIVSATPAPSSRYGGTLLKCNKCNLHQTGVCKEMHYRNGNKKGHTAHFCKAPTQPISQVPAVGVSQACYECGEIEHFKRNCPNTKNVGSVGRVFEIGHEEAIADPTVVTGTFLLNNSYACILFDSGARKASCAINSDIY